MYRDARRGEIDLGFVENASGARGFTGEGYPWHRWAKYFGLTFLWSTFVAKTTTIPRRAGNMPLEDDGMTPVSRKPDCIAVSFRNAAVVNSVGLSNFGFKFYLDLGIWQSLMGPFVISIMAVTDNWIDEFEAFADLLLHYYVRHPENWRSPIVIEINISCPNTGHDPSVFIRQAIRAMEILQRLGIAIRIKFNLLAPTKAVIEISRHEACQGSVMSNTIPWGELPHKINWSSLFGTKKSPLPEKYGGGGLSGALLTPLVAEKVKELRESGFRKNLTWCGGIMGWRDVRTAYLAGASSVQFGTVAIVRPWNTGPIIKFANEYGPGNRVMLRKRGCV